MKANIERIMHSREQPAVYLQMQAAEMIASNNLKLVREEDKQEGEERKFVRGLFYPDFVLADNLVFLLHD